MPLGIEKAKGTVTNELQNTRELLIKTIAFQGYDSREPLEDLVRTHIKYSWLAPAIYTGTIPEDSYWASLGCYP